MNVEARLQGVGLEHYAEAFTRKGVGEKLADAGIGSVGRIEDCCAPAIITGAIWSGHRYARELVRVSHPMAREQARA